MYQMNKTAIDQWLKGVGAFLFQNFGVHLFIENQNNLKKA
ncbi:hypothetical protein MiAbW_03334 [Microcystis aeruginosa NIES-4325]|uniref:Uncharacterized protein n=1 Tax=Microcystis aeruginosa NIES-4325 TaxID=2569534 RepID=A0A5J4FE44_MICAE|nr:hypothetical protein MiAbW_03334 [Microcystis aeruginosa NIES-4325]